MAGARNWRTVGAVRTRLMEILVCPLCKGALRLEGESEREDEGEVLAGWLLCEACPERYPIEDGIPNLLPPDLRA